MFNKLPSSFLRSPVTYFVLWAITLLIYIGLQYYFEALSQEENIVANIQGEVRDELLHLENETEIAYSILKSNPNPSNYWRNLDKIYEDSYRHILVYNNDSLIYWNNHYMSGDISNVKIDKFIVIEDQTGWYLVSFKRVEKYCFYLASLLKSKISTSNDLASSVQIGSWFNYSDLEFTIDSSSSAHSIYSNDGEFLFGINHINDNIIGKKMINVLFIVYLVCYVFLLMWITVLYYKFQNVIKNRYLLYLFFVMDILLLRSVEYLFHFPNLLKGSYIFEKQFDILYAFESVGDLLINSILFLFIALLLYNLLISNKYLIKTSADNLC